MAEEHVWDPLRRKEVALTPEERVRQWFITVLRDELGVPPYEMMSEATLSYGGKAWRADIVVYRRNMTPAMVVECKRPDVELTREVLEQALRYNLVLDVNWMLSGSSASPLPVMVSVTTTFRFVPNDSTVAV